MPKNTNAKVSLENQLLGLLKRVLPKATPDAHLAGEIYKAIEQELQRKVRASAFEKFCEKVELPTLEPKSIAAVQEQLKDAFGDADVTLKPNRKGQTLAVEVSLPDGSQWSSEIAVRPDTASAEDQAEPTARFVPFPVSLPGDKELVWFLAKRENLTPDEAGISLTKMQEDFWASKTGQKLLKDRVERSFPEFIARVPAGMLSEAGLKRHYKEPEAVKLLRLAPGRK